MKKVQIRILAMALLIVSGVQTISAQSPVADSKRERILQVLDQSRPNEYVPAAFFLHFENKLGRKAVQDHKDFYRATNTKELNQIYKEIDQLEKSKLNVKQFSKKYDVYQPFALVAVLALLLELLLRITVFRRIP